MLATMMVPAQVTMIPVFVIMFRLGWIDTHLPLIVPNWMGWAFGIFLMRQFFLQISSEMEDAAKIDGANAIQIFLRLFVPLSKPVLATLAVFAFLFKWNDLLGPIIYLTTQEKMTLTVGIATFKGFNRTRYALLMAGATISVIPILVIFIVAQKYFVRGDNDKRRSQGLSDVRVDASFVNAVEGSPREIFHVVIPAKSMPRARYAAGFRKGYRPSCLSLEFNYNWGL